MCSVFDPKKIKKTQRMCVCVCVRPHLHSAVKLALPNNLKLTICFRQQTLQENKDFILDYFSPLVIK